LSKGTQSVPLGFHTHTQDMLVASHKIDPLEYLATGKH
jgi:hypothetical protein